MKNAHKVADAIIEDMLARGGFSQLWDKIDDDTREEIRETWASIVSKGTTSRVTNWFRGFWGK